jgi:hypothetical protein
MTQPPRSPYADLPSERYWKTGVSEQHPSTIRKLYTRKFPIPPDMKIATAGSCFAQHIGGHLRAAGYEILDTEPAPPKMEEGLARSFGYKLYSARYGNVYLAQQLLQLAQEAYGLFSPALPVWERDGRFHDAMRPAVEPNGLSSPEEVMAHRAQHLAAVRDVLEQADMLIFTFGLTEGWVHRETGTVYPTAPGTIAGEYDPDVFAFKNYRASEIREAFLQFRDLVRLRNPGIRFLLTVSPVPLTATASEQHVLSATTYSKSVLRAVAGELAELDDIDYFPSYELISSPFSRGMYYSPNLRTVEDAGVQAVMRVFFDEHRLRTTKYRPPRDVDVQCEEALLNAFAG